MNMKDCYNMVLLLMWMMVMVVVEGRLLDMREEVYRIVTRHNMERRNIRLRASDMQEMNWDESLARRAQDYAMECQHSYPPRDRYDVGSNLYYALGRAYGKDAVERMVDKAMQMWTYDKDNYAYSRNCGMHCSYVQMINAETNRIGCAINTCDNLYSGRQVVNDATILVCFYGPRMPIMSSFPYTRGYQCSRCPRRDNCNERLCSDPNTPPVPAYYILGEPEKITQYADEMSNAEMSQVLSVTNTFRDNHSTQRLRWDPYLEKWSRHVVSCKADYPGPRHSYTNFHRLDQGDMPYSAVREWTDEGPRLGLTFVHGCRTPYDSEECTHYSNMLQSRLCCMACAARDCGDGTRQFVCVYDVDVERPYNRAFYDGESERLSPYRRGRRRRYRSRRQ